MDQAPMKSDRIGGLVTIILGIVSIVEAVRLFPSRTSLLVGDHTLPSLVGLIMILLGALLIFIRGETFRVEFPKGPIMTKMLVTLAIMFLYWLLIPILGYVICTLLALIGLYNVIGSYHLVRSVIYGVMTLIPLYLIFIYWLHISFPDGKFGF